MGILNGGRDVREGRETLTFEVLLLSQNTKKLYSYIKAMKQRKFQKITKIQFNK